MFSRQVVLVILAVITLI